MNQTALSQYEKAKNKKLTIMVTLLLSDGSREDEYIQGILKSVDFENVTITIEQHFPYLNLINEEPTETLLREFKLGQFTLIGNLKV
ncbi:MAG TPA: hypothetical protein PKH16_10665 [Aequorivita sp.]|nr:hypothetical protein [Aequorivita sp.]